MKTILQIAGLLFFLLIVLPLLFTIYSTYRFTQSDCGKLISVAQDADKAGYLAEWAAGAIRRTPFLDYTDREGGRRAQDDADFFRQVDIDWEHLELAREGASVALARTADAGAIAAIIIGSGPERIAVDLNGATGFGPGHPGHSPGEFALLFTAGEQGITVYCRNEPS